jgi:molecular chaperone GrpE
MNEEDTKKEQEVDDELVFEDEEDLENPAALIKKLRTKLRAVEAEKQDYLTGWQRAKADFINLRKKDEELKEDFMKFAKEGIVLDLIPVLDSFDYAFKNKEAWESLPKEWRAGMESIYTQLMGVLTTNGVAKLSLVKTIFDPKLAEAVGVVPTKEKNEDHTVLEELQAGYTLYGKVVRIARVKIGEYHE